MTATEKTVSFSLDGKTVQAREGETLLWVALREGIYIPNLCALPGEEEPFAGCRLCLVEIEGVPAPVPACTESARAGLIVHTQTLRVRRLQRTTLELILSAHPVDCGHCGKNRVCALQKIARHLGMKLKPTRLRSLTRNLARDETHPLFTYDPNKCVLCGRCVRICGERKKNGAFHFAYRGLDLMVSTFNHQPLVEVDCDGCGRCVAACPVGALLFKKSNPDRRLACLNFGR